MNSQIGIIIGRFQVPKLTEGHKEILNYVLSKNHTQNIIILGVSAGKLTAKNPLNFESRRRMIEEEFPGKFTIACIKDHFSDEKWSENCDNLIAELTDNRPKSDIILYGSRDSFKNRYYGKYKTEEYQQKVYDSGTELRKECGKLYGNSIAWRSGIVYATQNKYGNVYPTVDCAIFTNTKLTEMYVAKKKEETKYRFVGGFIDNTDKSCEEAVIREVKEETKLDINNIKYITSRIIDDWRYRYETEKIITSFYCGIVNEYMNSIPEASDDICYLYKVKLDELDVKDFNENHAVLFQSLKANLIQLREYYKQ